MGSTWCAPCSSLWARCSSPGGGLGFHSSLRLPSSAPVPGCGDRIDTVPTSATPNGPTPGRGALLAAPIPSQSCHFQSCQHPSQTGGPSLRAQTEALICQSKGWVGQLPSSNFTLGSWARSLRLQLTLCKLNGSHYLIISWGGEIKPDPCSGWSFTAGSIQHPVGPHRYMLGD